VPSEALGRILFLTHDDSADSMLMAEALDAALGLAGIVLESRWPHRLKRRLRRALGERCFRRLFGIFLLLRHGRLERRLRAIEEQLRDAADRELLEGAGRRELAWPPAVPILRTRDVNGEVTARWCRRREPDLFVLSSVSVLREPVLSIPRRGALNVHPSLLPDYRGPWPEFWQVSNGDTAAAGVTIHVATDRLDCGDIVLQKASPAPAGLDPYQLRNWIGLLARAIAPEAVRSFLTGAVAPRPQGAPRTPPHRVRDRTRSKRAELLRRLGHPV
jgi:hypothetical protein